MKPMKILHVANRAEKHDAKKYYSLPFKMNNGFVRNGHNVYWFSDRDVAKTSTIFRSGKMGKKACGEALIRVCKNFCPDVIALCHADLVLLSYLQEIKELLPDVKIFQYNIDALSTQGNIEKILSKISVVEHTFMTTAGEALRAVGRETAPASFIPNPVDASIDIYRNWCKTDLLQDLLFIGSRSDWNDPDSLRVQVSNGLPGDLVGLKVLVSQNLWGNSLMQAISSCKMGICFNQKPVDEVAGKGSRLYMCSSDRISLCMGNGLLTFVDSSFDMGELYGRDSLVEVSNYQEFIDKAYYYHKNDSERVRISRNGCELSHREFNEVLVARYMLETIFDVPYSHEYLWPTEQHIQ